MATVAELEAKVAAGGKVTPAELVAAQAAERIAAIEAERSARLAKEERHRQREAELQEWCEDWWQRIDAATDAAGAASDAVQAAAAAYNAAVDQLVATVHDRPPRHHTTDRLPSPPMGVGMYDLGRLQRMQRIDVMTGIGSYVDFIQFHRIEDQINAGTLKVRCGVCGEAIKPGDGIQMHRIGGGPLRPGHNEYCCPKIRRVSYGARLVNQAGQPI